MSLRSVRCRRTVRCTEFYAANALALAFGSRLSVLAQWQQNYCDSIAKARRGKGLPCHRVLACSPRGGPRALTPDTAAVIPDTAVYKVIPSKRIPAHSLIWTPRHKK